ncbi:MAG: DUF262 domain-containing protein [Bacteroidetes bacterium]|nr:DUF262 domain-containing protein [Bacteroidota bacterium]MBS1671312.1 DUF262 domain-containing protein [Bacteroidota bacterium]
MIEISKKLEENKLQLESLFKDKKLRVPSYQRAYAWEELQLNQFISDMLEIVEKGEYYYGHFILEDTNEEYYDIIDGQQRITTFILFLMVCRIFGKNDLDHYINKFETVDYDNETFKIIQTNLYDTNEDWDINNFKWLNQKDQTLSIQRILFALNHFRKLFKENIKSKFKLDISKIDCYIKTLTHSHISTHITKSKAVAVQIFELQNTRGVKLNLIEKVKAKLMKAVCLHGDTQKNEETILKIQNNFAEVYRNEEAVAGNAFRGDLTLEETLLHHLRIVDDGSKLVNKENDNGDKFNSPSKSGDSEEAILNYINNRISEKQASEIVDYIVNLSEKFKTSVELASAILPNYDEENRLIGDVLILDKRTSLEFFILLFNLKQSSLIQSKEFVREWEKFLFIRDFHDKYYRLRYKDNFEDLFFQISKHEHGSILISDILNKFITNGFRKDSMDEGNLPKTVITYIQNNKNNILNNAFHWWNEKMVYTLYKYEFSLNTNFEQLREIMKKGRSVDHILPQEWEWKWIGENDNDKISEMGKEFQKAISISINGIGNLLLVTKNENSSKGNTHPKDWSYKSCIGGSYSEHNQNSAKWDDYKEWKSLINHRGELIFDFLKEFIE